MLALEIRQRSCTELTLCMKFHPDNISNKNKAKKLHITHILDGISSRKYQQWKSNKEAA
jgi:hypothetical protein